MKTIFFLIVLFTLTACGSDNAENRNAQKASSASEKSSTTKSSPPVIADNSTAEHDHVEEDSGIEENNTPEEKEQEEVESIVFIETGAVQCDPNGVSKEETADLLSVNGITVLDSQCGDLTGILFAAQCGSPSPDINLHTVPTESLSAAIALGFKPVSALAQEDDVGYIVKDCKLPPQ